MKTTLLSLLLLGTLACTSPRSEQETARFMENRKNPKYLALGDSYTIGEGVPEDDRYPNQLVRRLNEETEYNWQAPKIIAKTGWTVDELKTAVNKDALTGQPYNLVTLSIGVNNQYRGRPVQEFRVEFEQMLLKAIGFAGNLPDHVIVLSIPDWGITPYATEKGADKAKVASEIDEFNKVKREVCQKYGVYFINITGDYRKIGDKPEMLVEDKLHPSGQVYSQWADKLFERASLLRFK